jgi:FkbM family methyltransferase
MSNQQPEPTDAASSDRWNHGLRRDGLDPVTVIDVGAGAGTGPLYRGFPDAYHVLIEPQREFEEVLNKHLQKWRGELHLTAVGAEEGEAVLHVDPDKPMRTSLLEPPSGRPKPPEERRVPVTTLDRLAAECGWQPPFGVKVDAEGTDHLVIMGATEVLKETQFVIAEIWVSPTYDIGCTFAEFVALMDTRGFELRDILNAPRSRVTGDVLYVDALFRPARRRGAG